MIPLQRTRQHQRLPMLLNGPGNPPHKIAHSPWDFVTLPEEDRATSIGNVHRKIGKDHACGSGDMLADRQTDRQTDTYTRSIVLNTILHHRSSGLSKYAKYAHFLDLSTDSLRKRNSRYRPPYLSYISRCITQHSH